MICVSAALPLLQRYTLPSNNGVILSEALFDTYVPVVTRLSAPSTTPPSYETARIVVPVDTSSLTLSVGIDAIVVALSLSYVCSPPPRVARFAAVTEQPPTYKAMLLLRLSWTSSTIAQCLPVLLLYHTPLVLVP